MLRRLEAASILLAGADQHFATAVDLSGLMAIVVVLVRIWFGY